MFFHIPKLVRRGRLGMRWKHAAPTELCISNSPDNYKHAAPTELNIFTFPNWSLGTRWKFRGYGESPFSHSQTGPPWQIGNEVEITCFCIYPATSCLSSAVLARNHSLRVTKNVAAVFSSITISSMVYFSGFALILKSFSSV